MVTAFDADWVAVTHAAVPLVAVLVIFLAMVLPGVAYAPPKVSEQVRVNVSFPVQMNVTPPASRRFRAAPAAIGTTLKARPSPSIAPMMLPLRAGVDCRSGCGPGRGFQCPAGARGSAGGDLDERGQGVGALAGGDRGLDPRGPVDALDDSHRGLVVAELELG